MLLGRHSLVVTDDAGRSLARLRLGPVVQLGALALMLLLVVGSIMGLHRWHQAAVQAPIARSLQGHNTELARGIAQLGQDLARARLTLADSRVALGHLHRRIGLWAPPPPAAEDAPTTDTLSATTDVQAAASAQDRAAQLVMATQRLELSAALLSEAWRDAERRLRHTPSIRPARTAWQTSSFGVRADPMLGHWVMHKGLDLGGPLGMLILAPADGVVVWTGLRGGYGQLVVVDHGWGLQTHFAHLSRALVTRGEQVQRGDPIAEMGSSGRSTGPHLHYEVRQDGVPLDPRRFILD